MLSVILNDESLGGTVQMRERVRKRDKKVKKKRFDLRRQPKMEREGAAATCDGRLFIYKAATIKTRCHAIAKMAAQCAL